MNRRSSLFKPKTTSVARSHLLSIFGRSKAAVCAVRASRNKGASGSSHGTSTSQVTSERQDEVDYSKLSVQQLIALIKELNHDPVVEDMLLAFEAKLPKKLSAHAETETSARSTSVVNGPREADSKMLPSQHQK
ncbi:hypothetical protein Aduo_005201 [Ancylostoma duodenale]